MSVIVFRSGIVSNTFDDTMQNNFSIKIGPKTLKKCVDNAPFKSTSSRFISQVSFRPIHRTI